VVVKGCIILQQYGVLLCAESGYILVTYPCEHVKDHAYCIKGRERPTHLRVSGVTVAKEAFIVRWDGVRCYVERFVQELEVRHVMADTNRVSFAICIRLPPVRHSTNNNATTVSVSLLLKRPLLTVSRSFKNVANSVL
jgi:hypothetical protein